MAATIPPGWTNERVWMLRGMWADMIPASHIAATLCLTRSAVIGKLRRLGLFDGRGRNHKRTRPKPKREWEQQVDAAAFDAGIPLEQRKTILEVTDETCRWPIGEGAAMFFCGGQTVEGRPYCEHHCLRAYTKPARAIYVSRRLAA